MHQYGYSWGHTMLQVHDENLIYKRKLSTITPYNNTNPRPSSPPNFKDDQVNCCTGFCKYSIFIDCIAILDTCLPVSKAVGNMKYVSVQCPSVSLNRSLPEQHTQQIPQCFSEGVLLSLLSVLPSATDLTCHTGFASCHADDTWHSQCDFSKKCKLLPSMQDTTRQATTSRS